MKREPDVQMACKLEFSVETQDYGGEYAPLNNGRIWITDKEGVGVRSLNGWGGRRSSGRALMRWKAMSVVPDAVTSASLRTYGAHDVSWDCTDANGDLVPLGTYIIHVEFSSSGGAAPYFAIPFEHAGTMPLAETVAPMRGFAGATLRYKPGDGGMGP
jgi:hypothetical protein